MRYLSLFSGIEAASCAWSPLGWQCAGVSEIEPFPCAVLAYHYPNVPNLGDVNAITQERLDGLGPIDLLVGGSPCQAFSVAGLRRSLDDARGNLALRYVQIADMLQGALVLWENVPGVLSVKDNAFGCFLAGLVGADAALQPGGNGRWGNAGVVAGPKRSAVWRVLDAQYFGVPQRRRRVFVLAGRVGAERLAEVLLERESLCGNPAKGRAKREDVAPTIAARTRGGGGLGTDFDLDGGLVVGGGSQSEISVAPSLTRTGGRFDFETEAMVVTHTLCGEGFDASEDGSGRGTPLVPPAFHATQDPIHGDVTPALGSNATIGVMAFDAAQVTSKANRSTVEPGRECHTLSAGNAARAHVASQMAVRRLTPVECERLQGFPDDYTRIPLRKKTADQCPDGPRYKALGNSMAVPVMNWIGSRIQRFMGK